MAKPKQQRSQNWNKTKLDRLPWGRMYIDRWMFSDTHRKMSFAERGVFWDIICLQHLEGGVVPNDPKELAAKLHSRATTVPRFWRKYGPNGAQVWQICTTDETLAYNENYNNSNPENCIHPAVAYIREEKKKEEEEKSGSPSESVLSELANIDFSREPDLTVK